MNKWAQAPVPQFILVTAMDAQSESHASAVIRRSLGIGRDESHQKPPPAGPPVEGPLARTVVVAESHTARNITSAGSPGPHRLLPVHGGTRDARGKRWRLRRRHHRGGGGFKGSVRESVAARQCSLKNGAALGTSHHWETVPHYGDRSGNPAVKVAPRTRARFPRWLLVLQGKVLAASLDASRRGPGGSRLSTFTGFRE